MQIASQAVQRAQYIVMDQMRKVDTCIQRAYQKQAIIKPQYVDHIPKAVRGNVREVLDSKDQRQVKAECVLEILGLGALAAATAAAAYEDERLQLQDMDLEQVLGVRSG
eukprot:888425-Pelagomonas_calceolata.AAC.2